MKLRLVLIMAAVHLFYPTAFALASEPVYRKLDCYATGKPDSGVPPETDFEKTKCLFIKGGHFYLDNNSGTGSLKASLVSSDTISIRISSASASLNLCDVSFNVKVDPKDPNHGVSTDSETPAKVTFAKDRIMVEQLKDSDSCGHNAYFGGDYVRPLETESNFCRSVVEGGQAMLDCIKWEREKADRILNGYWQALRGTYTNPRTNAEWQQLTAAQNRLREAADLDCATAARFQAGAEAEFERLQCEARHRVARTAELELRFQQRKPQRR